MMLSSHVLAGGVLGMLVSTVFDFPVSLLVLTGMAASLIPDLDFLLEHRKTLHRPFQYLLLSITSTFFIGFNASMAFLSVIFGSMSLHSITEVISQPEGKKEDGCAVYDHLRCEWISQRNLFMVGSATDLIISTLLFLSIAVYGGFSVRLASSVALLFGVLRFFFPDNFDGWIHKHSPPDS